MYFAAVRRSLTGAWIETPHALQVRVNQQVVAPLRGRGLKQVIGENLGDAGESLPYGGVD